MLAIWWRHAVWCTINQRPMKFLIKYNSALRDAEWVGEEKYERKKVNRSKVINEIHFLCCVAHNFSLSPSRLSFKLSTFSSCCSAYSRMKENFSHRASTTTTWNYFQPCSNCLNLQNFYKVPSKHATLFKCSALDTSMNFVMFPFLKTFTSVSKSR